MKKVLTAIVIVTVIAISLSFSLASFAAATHIECEEFDLYGGEQLGGANLQEGAGYKYIGCKPDEVGTTCYTSYIVDIPTTGKYNFKIQYFASGDGSEYARKGDLVLNEDIYNMPLLPTGDWETPAIAIVAAELKAGPLTIKIASPADYDDTTVKTGNFDWIEYELIEDKAVEAVEAPVEAGSNPKTDDVSVIFYALLTISAFCGVFVNKKK